MPRYDHDTQHAFVGDYSGQITLLKLERQTYSTITTLKGHEGNDNSVLFLSDYNGWAGQLCENAGPLTRSRVVKLF